MLVNTKIDTVVLCGRIKIYIYAYKFLPTPIINRKMTEDKLEHIVELLTFLGITWYNFVIFIECLGYCIFCRIFRIFNQNMHYGGTIMGEPLFQINILPVDEGDCIHLRFFADNKWYNIIIDSGPKGYISEDPDEEEENQSRMPFLKLLKSIQKKHGEVVDLLCFTHIDDDHLEAAKVAFSKDRDLRELIKEVWINIPEWEKKRTESKDPDGLEQTSVENAIELYRYLLWYQQHRNLVLQTEILAGTEFHSKEVKVSAVLPNALRLERYKVEWPKESPQDSALVQTSTQKPARKKSSDQSNTNGASIVLQVEACGWRMLFTGDTFAVNLCDMVKEREAIGETVHYDLVKLPHHGSSANITHEMLKKLGCKCFVISADGVERHSQRRPDAVTVQYLGQYGKAHESVTLYGNYEWYHIQETEGVQVVRLTAKETMLTELISIKAEVPEC